MRILYDYEIFSLQKYGGASRYITEVISRLCLKKGVDISLFMGYYINDYGLENSRDYCEKFFGKKLPFIPKVKNLYNIPNRIFFKSFYKKIDFDIFHQTYFNSFKYDNKGKFIVTVLDMIHEIYPDYFSAFDFSRKYKKIAVNAADGIICISNSTKNDLINILNVPEDKIEVIHLANSLNLEVNTKRIIDYPYILYVGKRRGYKNFLKFIEAYSKEEGIYKNINVLCFGGGGITDEESKILKDLKIYDKVFQKTGSDEMLANIYKYSSAFVYPSEYEGFGIPPLEAMNYGCPMVVSNKSSIPEVVGDAGLYFDPDNKEELIEKLKQVLFNSNIRKELISNGYRRVKDFTWDKCADETYSFYKKLI